MRFLLLFVGLLFGANMLAAQTPLIESSTRKAWQPNQQVRPADFQAVPSAQLRNLQQKAGLLTDSRISFSSVLDVPRRKRDRGPLLEKAYFAAIWLKDQSATLTTDTAEMAKQQILFDLAELSARKARRTLQALQDSTRAYGTAYIYYVTVANQACALYHRQAEAYTKAIYIDNNPVAYAKWRKMVHLALQETAAYATSAQDAQRLIDGKPVEPEYEQSPTVLGTLGCK